MKISIIIPTYNDGKTIKETLNSIFEQTYKNFEIVIVDDGSTDDTKEIIEQYKKEQNDGNKITYIYQENKDQLNAILNGLNYIHGDFVFTLHSDDLINESNSLEKCVKYMEEHSKLDAIIGNLTIIDKDNNITGTQIVRKYTNKKYMIPLQLLWLGRNLYIDVGFFRKEAYIEKVKENYLKWNTPFWIDFKNKSMLNVEKVEFSFYKYRVFDENYINDFQGKLNVINGELRTAIQIMDDYSIPFYKIQYFLFRLFNKFKITYIPMYTNKMQKNKAKIIKFIMQKRFGNSYNENEFLNALVNFYCIDSKKSIELTNITDDIYIGKDVRTFNKKLLNGELPNIYSYLINQMNCGFNKIFTYKKDKEKLENLCRFLCINPNIEILENKT